MKEEQVRIVVQVQPNASQNRVARLEDGVLYLKIAAPPIKGKANQELIRFLSDILGVSKTSLTILKGERSKRKVIAIEGLSRDKISRRLEKLKDSQICFAWGFCGIISAPTQFEFLLIFY